MKTVAIRSNRSPNRLRINRSHRRSLNRCLGLVVLSLVALTGCLPSQQAKLPSDSIAAENALRNQTAQNFSKPIIPEADPNKPSPTQLPLATIPVKGLMKATRPADLVDQAPMNANRDPFSALPSNGLNLPLIKSSKPKIASKKPSTVQKAPQKVAPKSIATRSPRRPSLPIAPSPLTPLSPLATVPVQNNLPSFENSAPIADLPMAPLVSQTNLAEQVEITGVIQVGDRIMAIAKAPEETSARYINSGDVLSGGRVIVREIRAGNSPTVILEQNGQRIVKSIGVNRVASARSI